MLELAYQGKGGAQWWLAFTGPWVHANGEEERF